MDHFATNFDKDSDGVIDFEEFKLLYAHLGATPEDTAVEIAQDDPCAVQGQHARARSE